MKSTKKPTAKAGDAAENEGADKEKALATALAQIEKGYGKGAVMKLGEGLDGDIPSISTGSLTLDLALGIGGVPRGRHELAQGARHGGDNRVLYAADRAQDWRGSGGGYGLHARAVLPRQRGDDG